MTPVPHIENFELVERLGRGGMAVVWKARQNSLDRFVAIKVLSSSHVMDPSDIARFREEARSAGRLKHPGIVQVYDANFTDGNYYFVMELVDGYTVGEWIRRKQRIEEGDALTVAENVIQALDYAWSDFNIIHCDIKSENIMVDADGTVKVTDLGLARAIVSAKVREQEAEVLGTPAYMSPEQATGQSDLDCRADIYALGATLYHMVTGHTLFAGETQEDVIMRNQLVATMPNPAHEVHGLSHGFVLLTKMLAKDRKYRHKDWKAVLADIRRVRERHAPAGPLPPAGGSTILLPVNEADPVRWQAMQASAAARYTPQGGQEGGSGVLRVLVMAGAVLAVALVVWWFAQGGASPRPALRPKPTTAAVSSAEARCREALAYVRANPADWRGGVPRLEAALQEGPPDSLAGEAGALRDELLSRREGDLQGICGPLGRQARELEQRGRVDEALQLLEHYQGAYTTETAGWRQDQARLIRKRRDAAAPARESAPAVEPPPPPPGHRPAPLSEPQAVAQVTRGLLAGASLAQAIRQAGDLAARLGDADKAELDALQKLLGQARDIEKAVLSTFLPQKGLEVTVELLSGSVKGVVSDVREGKVWLAPGNGSARSFTLDEVSLVDRMRRLRGVDDGGNAGATLLKAVWACRSRARDRARTLLLALPAPAGPALVRALDAQP